MNRDIAQFPEKRILNGIVYKIIKVIAICINGQGPFISVHVMAENKDNVRFQRMRLLKLFRNS
ncbi:TPA: hypothetical protein MH640_10165 [Klebsiella pneumoniae]|nr:hypothetical protein [Klebsiella pneumoniae]PLN47715.1 hypothetical protein CWN65_23905 [Klebsiella pneumoniae]HBX6174985.1 hypothetical protein [Klebsiella pneumoniae]